MSLDVYQPCSCGSGKKFKFCCYQKRKALEGVSDSDLIKRAAEFPVYDVRVSADWQEEGMAQVVVARQLPNLRYLIGVYLVDTFCLGLKDTFVRPQLKYEDLEDLLSRFPGELEEIAYEDARSIVLGGIEYARQIGFEPQRDWKHTSSVIEGDRDFKRKFNYGQDGVPFYVQGPNDDSAKILEKLKPLIKEGKAHFISAADQRIHDRELDFEDECGDVSDLLERGNHDQARRVIERLIKKNPERSEPQFLMGTCLAMEGKMKEAIGYLEKAARMNPSAEVYFNLAGAYRSSLMLNESMTSLKKVIELDGKNGEHGKRAKRDMDELTKVIKQHTGLSVEQYMANKAKFEEAFKHLTEGRYEEAILGFNAVLTVEPNHVQSYGNLGLAYAGLGDRESAIEHFDKAIELDPNYQPAIDNRRVAMALAPGEKMNTQGMREIEFYTEKAKADTPEQEMLASPMPTAVKPSVGQRIKDLFWR